MAEGEEAELLLVATHGFEVADADGFVELRGAVGVGAHGFFLSELRSGSCSAGLVV